MAVENWIDEIADLAGTVPAVTEHGKKFVRSYRLFKREEYPAALTEYPCALTYIEEVIPTYSAGSLNYDIFHGVTEFHLAAASAVNKMPDYLRYIQRIKTAFAGKMTLGGKVAYCLLRNDVAGIEGPVKLQYGEEPEHPGYIVRWVVKEIDATLTVAG